MMVIPPCRNVGSVDSWMRVAMGLEKVLRTMASKDIKHPTTSVMIPSSNHFPELVSSLQIALQQVIQETYKHSKTESTTTTTSQPVTDLSPQQPGSSSHQKTTSIRPTTTIISPIQKDSTLQNSLASIASINEVAQNQPLMPTMTPIIDKISKHDVSIGELTNSINMPKDINHTSQIQPQATTSFQNVHQQVSIKEGAPVPSTRAGRALGFANLGFGLLMGTVAESARRMIQPASSSKSTSVVLNDKNSDRLAASLCRMRGAALKMGQMLSIQDESLLPPPLVRALQQVRQGADAMPRSQLEQQLTSQLGANWRDKFVDFDMNAFAAASIGQVHRATISSTINNQDVLQSVVVKVQYPGVAQSIESDLRNLAMLVTWSGLAPRGLFIENVIRVGRDELKAECNYRQELRNQQRIKALVESEPILQENRFRVPYPFEHLTTDEIITSEYIAGGTIDKIAATASQDERNRIGHTILYLTMKELFDWRFMQTDPNWGNFLYDVNTRTTGLIDFGATREYSKAFVDGYLRIVWASSIRDETTLMEQSHLMGFLTGNENEAMLRAHKLSGYTVGEPFNKDEAFDFRASRISERMGEHTSVFLQHRLTAPPEEVYTLHRKLAGAYMLCIKLNAIVESPRRMLESIVANHTFDDGKPNPITGR
jgi:aarF domain-containing kinase